MAARRQIFSISCNYSFYECDVENEKKKKHFILIIHYVCIKLAYLFGKKEKWKKNKNMVNMFIK